MACIRLDRESGRLEFLSAADLRQRLEDARVLAAAFNTAYDVACWAGTAPGCSASPTIVPVTSAEGMFRRRCSRGSSPPSRSWTGR